MAAALAFGLTLLVGVLISELARRTVLSTAVLLLGVGFILGSGVAGVVVLEPEHDLMARFAELALFSMLFADGMRLGGRDVRSASRLPGRALLFGFPLTLAGNVLLAHSVVGLDWRSAFLIGAVLTPTDPVFASALVGRRDVPAASGICSTSREASTMGWRCRSWSSCSPWPPAARSTAGASPRNSVSG